MSSSDNHGPPPPGGNGDTIPDNPNQHISTMGMITTLLINIGVFVLIQWVFEVNRFYKQIYLKRLQKRFEEIGRVPPIPPHHVFGWLKALYDVSEMDVLRMVGLDAYMLLRYHVVCWKLSLFMSFWGIIALTPIYSTATNNIFETGSLQWDHYTLRNVVNGASETKYRLWAAAVFGYIFAAYFMQLLYAEYNNFSVRRLQYLVQANPDSPQGDPDTPPQKYFTIMVENIPGHLRSAAALYKFFEKLFPGEVFNVEIALDLSELNALTAKREGMRDKLEKAIAAYEATNVRPQLYLQTGNVSLFPDGSQALASESNTFVSWLQQYWAPEMYGYELVDSISYYTLQLQDLNRKVDEMQHVSFEYARNADKDLVRKLRNKSDTRAAAMVETLKTSANIFTDQLTGDGSGRGNQAGGGGANGKSGGQSPRKKKKRKTSLTTDSNPPMAAAASAAARSVQSNGNGSAVKGSGVGPRPGNGAVTKAPFWETFLFGAQAPEFNDVAKSQMRKIAVNEPNSGKSANGSNRNNKSNNNVGVTTHNPLLTLAAAPGPPPKQPPQPQTLPPVRRGSGNSLAQAVDDEVKLTVKASGTGGFKLQIVDDDDDDEEDDDSDDSDSDDGRPAHPPGHLVRTLSEATRPENFDLMLKAGQASKPSMSKTPWAATLAASKLKPAAAVTATTNLPSGLSKQQQALPRPADVAVVAAAASSSSHKQATTTPLNTVPLAATQKHQQQPLTEPQRQPIPDVVPKASQFVPFHDADTAGKEHGAADVAGAVIAVATTSNVNAGYVDLGGSGSSSHASARDSEKSRASEEESVTDTDHDNEEGQDKDNLLFHLEEDATLREWMKTAHVDVQQELEQAERRAEKLAVDARSAKYLTSAQAPSAFPSFGKLKDINDLLGQAPTPNTATAGEGGAMSGGHRRSSFSLSASMADALASVAETVTSAIHSSGGLTGVTPPVSGSPPDKDKGQDKEKGQDKDTGVSGRSVRFHDDNDDDGDVVAATADPALAQSSTQSSARDDDDDDHSGPSTPVSSSRGPQGGDHHDHPPSPSRPDVESTRRVSYDPHLPLNHGEDEVIDDGSVRGREAPPTGVFQSLGLVAGKKKTRLGDFGNGSSSSGGADYFSPDYGPGQGQEQGSSQGQTNRGDFFGLGLLNAGDIGLSQEQIETANKQANKIAKVGWEQTKIAGSGALRGIIEVERAFEMLTLGAYYKYSSTAFVTFNSRITESIAQQMLLSHDAMEVNHAPNPNDIIWDNVSIPRSQIRMRNFITNTGIIVGSLFWSSLVTSINDLAATADLPQYQQQYLSVLIVLVCLLVLPFIFDFLARYYEGIKLESEIQATIMTRYFWYQLINVYVTVGFGGVQIVTQILMILKNPQLLVNFVGQTIPSVSLYFVDMVIVKIFTAVPLEMIRPWQIITIHLMSRCMDRRKTTRRDLRTGAFYAWPMLYGWIYPQLLMVTMIMVTYACIAPLLMPFCAMFFAFAYLMYKYQLLYVYINDYQSGGDMWYATFGRSLISLIFAALTLLGYLSLELQTTYLAGPFYFLFPLPFCIIYFWYYCEAKFKKPSMNLSFGFAKELDHRNAERRTAGKPVPHDSFRKDLYRQPSLTQQEVYPEPYRRDSSYEHLRQSPSEEDLEAAAATAAAAADDDVALLRSTQQPRPRGRGNRGTMSINVHEELDQGEDCQAVLKAYFEEVVLPLAREVALPESLLRRRHSLSEQQSSNNDNHAADTAPAVLTRQRS